MGEGVHNPADVTGIEANIGLALFYLAYIINEVDGLDGDAMRGTDDAALAVDYTALRAGYLDVLAPANLPTDIDLLIQQHLDFVGPSVVGRAVTATLWVSPNGDNTDGLTLATAFQNIPAALDAASADGHAMTLILIAPHPTYYDIDITGDPTWAKNVRLQGTMSNFCHIRNEHVSATSILKLTGLAVLAQLSFDVGATDINGVILSSGGSRVFDCDFDGELSTGTNTLLWLNGEPTHGPKVFNNTFRGDADFTTGWLVDQIHHVEGSCNHFFTCLNGIWLIGADCDNGHFAGGEFSSCKLGIRITSGNNHWFDNMGFYGCARNVLDAVGDSLRTRAFGAFDIYITPANFTGFAVAAGGAGNTYGADTELIAAGAITNPFRIVGTHFEPDAAPAESYMVRFSANAGVSYYDEVKFITDKREGVAAPSGTEHIFNPLTRISCSAKSESGGNNVAVWLEIQEI